MSKIQIFAAKYNLSKNFDEINFVGNILSNNDFSYSGSPYPKNAKDTTGHTKFWNELARLNTDFNCLKEHTCTLFSTAHSSNHFIT